MKISQKNISTVLIRRGGAPSGAAAFIVLGGMGVSTPISNSRRPIYYGNVVEIFILCTFCPSESCPFL
jgi:hypothetical protein